MNLSSETFNVLKNFSNISPSLVVKTGNTLRTISPMKNIYAKYNGGETFDRDFALYDLNEFLSGVSLFKDPDSRKLNRFTGRLTANLRRLRRAVREIFAR